MHDVAFTSVLSGYREIVTGIVVWVLHWLASEWVLRWRFEAAASPGQHNCSGRWGLCPYWCWLRTRSESPGSARSVSGPFSGSAAFAASSSREEGFALFVRHRPGIADRKVGVVCDRASVFDESDRVHFYLGCGISVMP